jgi:hypothetical protein
MADDAAFNGAMTMRGKSKFGGQANKPTGEAERAAVDAGRFDHMAAGDIKDRFLARLKVGSVAQLAVLSYKPRLINS